jgi:ABC-type glutathione transport system ATPase component
MDPDHQPLLEIKDLTVERPAELGERRIGLRRVSLAMERGEIVVLAGENGSGRSLLARLVAGAAGPQMKLLGGTLHFEGRDLLRMKRRDFAALRRGPVAMIPGEPDGQLNPDRTVRQWLRDFGRMAGGRSGGFPGEKDWSDYFYRVGIIEPERILPRTPGDLSPLIVKRLLVMRAVMAGARLLICDEVTAGLDRIAASQFLELLCQVRQETEAGILLTTGSLRGVERFADRVAVFFEGGILEAGPPTRILENPRFAYTSEFRACDPRLSDLPRELPSISREAVREAEEAVHEAANSPDAGTTG